MSLLGTGVASASASYCHISCIAVSGTKLYVSSVGTSEEVGHLRAGYYFAKAVNPTTNKETWEWSSWVGAGHVVQFQGLGEKSYANGTSICGGVEPTKAEKDYSNEACVSIHS